VIPLERLEAIPHASTCVTCAVARWQPPTRPGMSTRRRDHENERGQPCDDAERAPRSSPSRRCRGSAAPMR
jgi:hypothetical protein